MPDPADRLVPPPTPSPLQEPSTTDRKIALAGVFVAAVGAAAAIAVVPEFRCWALHDACSTPSTAATVAAVPAILGLTGFIASLFLRRAKGNDQITLRIIDKIRLNAPDLLADRLEIMSPSALSKTIAVNALLRSQVGEHDFQLLRAALQNQFIISLVVYGLCGFCFIVGGALYFLLQPPPLVGQRLIFRDDHGSQVVVTGTAEVVYHGEKRSDSFRNATDIVIGGISSNEIGSPFTLLLKADDYELQKGLAAPFTFSKDAIFVPVKLKPFDPYAGSVFIGSDPAPGAKVTLFGLPCKTVTGGGGYFEFGDCPQSRRLQAAKLELTLPLMGSPCANKFPLLQPPALTAIKVSADCSRFETGVMACPSCKPDFVDSGEKPNIDLCRRDIKAELWSRLHAARWPKRDACAVMCHLQVSGGVVHVQPGRLQFRAPDSCETTTAFELDAGQFFSDR
jgi:hypothetical protein